jgi:hypothetical protein
MARRNSTLVIAACVAVLCTATARAEKVETYAGLQGLVIVGDHRDAAGTQNGIGGGPLLELHAATHRFAIHLEGIPVVGIPGVKPSVAYGQATPSIGIFNSQFEYEMNPSLRVGLGETIYNQRTPLPAINQVVSSRLCGLRFAARYTRDTTNNHFIEGLAAITPTLRGADRYVFSDGSPTTEKPERASSVEISLALGYRRGSTEWLFGLRHLNFAAQFVNTGEAADRNVGIGPMLEWRHYFK